MTDKSPGAIGVRFEQNCNICFFDVGENVLEVGEKVVVETNRGLELATVIISSKQVLLSEIEEPLPSIIRKATEEDLAQAGELEKKAASAMEKCSEIAGELGLTMKLVSARYTIDGRHLLILFTAESRVDFRELVHQLASQLRTRVELRQIGSRDEAKLLGGLGPCGRPLCCSTFLPEFTPVSIKMAKEQGLSLDPAKISGVCGRLLCCLGYESGYYRSEREKMPKKGQSVKTASGSGVVTDTDIFKETVTVDMESGGSVEVPLGEIISGKD